MDASPDEVITLLQKHKPSALSLRVLDLGCCKGAVSTRLAQNMACHCLGIDAMPAFIDEAKQKAKEYAVDERYQFQVADIRHEIKQLGLFDVIVLGAIGPIFGDYQQTLTILAPHLCTDGVILIDDAYVENLADTPPENILHKAELLRQASLANMQLIDEIKAQEQSIDEHAQELLWLENRCNELMLKYPDKAALFKDYLANQQQEYDSIETQMTCAIMLFRQKI